MCGRGTSCSPAGTLRVDGPLDPESFAIIGAAIHVHQTLGPGFLEAVYQESLAREFAKRAIPFQREAQVPVYYEGALLGAPYRADFICYGSIIVELKASALLGIIEEMQVVNYLKATGYPFGLLFSFGSYPLQIRRLGNTRSG